MRAINYHISGSDVLASVCTGLSGLPYARRHWKIANHPATENKWGHRFVAILEFSPIVGFVVAILERLVAWILGWDSQRTENVVSLASSGAAPSNVSSKASAPVSSSDGQSDRNPAAASFRRAQRDSSFASLRSQQAEIAANIEALRKDVKTLQEGLNAEALEMENFKEELLEDFRKKSVAHMVRSMKAFLESLSNPFSLADGWRMESESEETRDQVKCIIKKIVPVHPISNCMFDALNIIGFQDGSGAYYHLCEMVVTNKYVQLTYMNSFLEDMNSLKYVFKNSTKYSLNAQAFIDNKYVETIEPGQEKTRKIFSPSFFNLHFPSKEQGLLFTTTLSCILHQPKDSDPKVLRNLVRNPLFEPRLIALFFSYVDYY